MVGAEATGSGLAAGGAARDQAASQFRASGRSKNRTPHRRAKRVISALVPEPRNQLNVRTRQRLTGELGRLVEELGAGLAAAVSAREPHRLDALHQEIHDYALALLRARLGLLSGTAGADATSAALPASAGESQPTRGGPHRSRAKSKAPPGKPAPLRRDGRDYQLSAAMLKRFCQLTGVSESHIGGCGSNLAGIAFYFDVFAILTADTDVPLETLGQLLDQLRETRERIDAFVVHWLNTTGWRCSDLDPVDVGRWLDGVPRPARPVGAGKSLNPPT